MILCQLILLIIMVFGAGIFLPWKDCPKYVLAILICMHACMVCMYVWWHIVRNVPILCAIMYVYKYMCVNVTYSSYIHTYIHAYT